MLGVHDRIIGSAKVLAEILGKGEITKEEGEKVVATIRKDILPHPIECEGLTLLAEKLGQGELDTIVQNLESARREDIPLLVWADKVRVRKISYCDITMAGVLAEVRKDNRSSGKTVKNCLPPPPFSFSNLLHRILAVKRYGSREGKNSYDY